MILWFRHLPAVTLQNPPWVPFIRNDNLRQHYMKGVYGLMAVIAVLPGMLTGSLGYAASPLWALAIVPLFLVHEALHVATVYTQGDISLTFRGIFFWLNTDAVMSKARFWLFMSLPFLLLSVVPGGLAWFFTGEVRHFLLFLAWVNGIISSSDIINSVLILAKPRHAIFCRGYYRVESGS